MAVPDSFSIANHKHRLAESAFDLKLHKPSRERVAVNFFNLVIGGLQFEIEGGVTQTMFMIGDAEGIWNGQFTGTKERWAEALSILKKLKKRG